MKRKTVTLTALMITMMLTLGVGGVNAATYPNLPSGPVTLQVVRDYTTSYFISTLSGVPAGYDVMDGVYPGWCVDRRYNIPTETNIMVTLHSSLSPPTLLASQDWDMVNYILNNKAGAAMMDIQNAIWYFVKMDGVGWWDGVPSSEAQAIVDDAIANGDGYLPGSGDILAIICLPNPETQITIIEIEIPKGCEGLTPGFWKRHPDLWMGYSTDDTFFDIFGVEITINAGKKDETTNPTLLEALMAKGGVVEEENVYDALARHAVAALLNAAHLDVNYPLSKQEIIDAVAEAIGNSDNTDAEPLKNMLDGYNNLGGGIDAHGNPI